MDKQMAMMSGLGRIFEIGPAFRADPSFTSRHATEFTSVDIEVSHIASHEDIMSIQEQLLQRGLQAVKDAHGEEIKALFDVDIVVPSVPFPRVSITEAYQIIAERGHTIERGGDLDLDFAGGNVTNASGNAEFTYDSFLAGKLSFTGLQKLPLVSGTASAHLTGPKSLGGGLTLVPDAEIGRAHV